MKKTQYWIIGIILLIIVGYGGYRLMKHYKNLSMNSPQQTTSEGNAANPTAQNTAGSTGLTNKTDTSNQQLDQDLQDIQGSMSKLNSDQNQAAQAVSNQSSDTPIQ